MAGVLYFLVGHEGPKRVKKKKGDPHGLNKHHQAFYAFSKMEHGPNMKGWQGRFRQWAAF